MMKLRQTKQENVYKKKQVTTHARNKSNCLRNNFNKISILTCACILGGGVLLADDLNNQDDTDSNQSQNEQIQKVKLDKVTATADKELDLPETSGRNVIVIDKQDLQDKGYTNLEQALEHQPAITFTPGPNGQKQIDMRGQGMDAMKTIKVLVNGVPINPNQTGFGATGHGLRMGGNTPFDLIDVNDIESIEILPGGGSVVYGSGTRGGVINLVTKKPSQDFTRFSLNGSIYEYLPSNAPMSKPRGTTKASIGKGYNLNERNFLNISASYMYKNGLRRSEYTKDAYFSIGNIYQINENKRLDFSASYTRHYSYFLGYQDNQGKTIEQMKQSRYDLPTGVAATSVGYAKQDLAQASLKYTNDINENLRFEMLGFYAFSDFSFPTSITADTENVPNTTYANTSGTNLNHNGGINLKLRRTTDNNTLLLGLDNNLEYSEAIRLPSSSGYRDRRKGYKYAGAIYALDSMRFGDFFGLTFGVRGEGLYYSVKRRGMTNRVSGAGTGGHPAVKSFEIQEGSQGEWKFNYAAEITPSVHYSDSGMLYAKGELGFINPTIAQITNVVETGQTSSGGDTIINREFRSTNLRPEQYITAEIGWRDEFIHSSWSLALFYTHSFNEIRYIPETYAYNYYNLGQTQRVGVDFSARQNIFDKILTLQESINFNQSNVVKGRENAGGSSASELNKENQSIPYVPNLKASVLVNLRLFKTKNHTFSIFANHSYTSQMRDSAYALMNKGGYTLGDVGFSYKYKKLGINGGVRNVYDTFYVAYQANGRYYLAGEARNYYAEVKMEF